MIKYLTTDEEKKQLTGQVLGISAQQLYRRSKESPDEPVRRHYEAKLVERQDTELVSTCRTIPCTVHSLVSSGEPPRIKCKGRRDNYNTCAGEILSVPGGELDASILASHKTGEERTEKYGIHYCINSYGSSSRTQAEIDLSKLDTTVDSIKQSMERAIILGTSVKSRELEQKWCTIALLKKEIESHRQVLQEMGEDSIEAPSLPSNATKSDVVSALIKYRKKIFVKHPNVRQEAESRISKKFEKAQQTTKKSRIELLESTLFRLSDSVRSRDRYNAK